MIFTQGLFEWIMQLLRCYFLPLFQIDLHQIFIQFDHLIDDLGVCLFY